MNIFNHIIYKDLLSIYISNSFKFNEELREKYTKDTLSNLSIEELEFIVAKIHPEYPLYNAMMAGAVYEYWEETACDEDLNLANETLDRYLSLFNISIPKNIEFKNENNKKGEIE